MVVWLLVAALGVPQFLTGFAEPPPVAPTDLVVGRQTVDLREPLLARTRGAKLVLFVRDRAALLGPDNAAFEAAVPPGSVTARLRAGDGNDLVLDHTGYAYYRGFAGLVLSEREPGTDNTLYDALEIEAAKALPRVRFMWLDRAGRRVQDLPAPR